MPTDALTGRARPVSGFKFRVTCSELQGVLSFTKVDGLEDETEVVDYREGMDPVTMGKHPGLSTFPNLTLERGVSSDSSLIAWRRKVVDLVGSAGTGAIGSAGFQADVLVELYDRAGQSVRRWEVKNAWPNKLSTEALDASSSDILINSLELAHEGLIAL